MIIKMIILKEINGLTIRLTESEQLNDMKDIEINDLNQQVHT